MRPVGRRIAAATLVFAVVLAAYLPSLRSGFVFDDQIYVTGNTDVNRGVTVDGLARALTSGHAANWHPLTWWSHMLDVSLFGLRPAGHHAVNVLLHALVAAMLVILLEGISGNMGVSMAAALLFALHPLRVESVAWIAERKDLLCALFSLLAVAAYAGRLRRPTGANLAGLYVASAAAMASKPMGVVLPVMLVLLDFWPLGRVGGGAGRWGAALGRSVAGKWPLWLMAVGTGAAAVWAQAGSGAVVGFDRYPPWVRVANALRSYVAYLRDTLFPAGLSPLYPHPGDAAGGWGAVGAGVCLAAASWVILRRARRSPAPAFGWLWFVLLLLPVIGLIQVGPQGRADRYTYLPSVGLLFALAWESDRLGGLRRGARRAPLIGCAVALFLLLPVTIRQQGVWRDNLSLFARAAAVTEGNWTAHNNLGTELTLRGRLAEAEAEYLQALAIRPDYGTAHYNLANLLMRRGRFDQAVDHYRRALASDPGNPIFARRLEELGL
jgi:hypothetical protein